MTGARLENVRILIVDDSAYMRVLLSSVLRTFGVHEFRAVESAPDAIHQLQKFQADMAIVDWMMEPVDGIEFVKHLRHSKINWLRLLPVVMLTGHTGAEHIATAKAAGVNSFLGKPFTPNALYNQIVHILRTPNEFIYKIAET